MGGRSGRYINVDDRTEAVTLINEAVSNGARLRKACEILDISTRTFERWVNKGKAIKIDGRLTPNRALPPSNKLTKEERKQIISIAISKEFVDLTPWQIVAKLADRNKYIASESSFYRVLKEHKLSIHRSKSRGKSHKKPNAYIAKAPNEIWCWDITYLPTVIKGAHFYLYLILDVFSRKIVGYEVYDIQSAEYASVVARQAYIAEKINGKQIILHSDNGSPMKGATMIGTLQMLGVVPSFSRPSVSNDNPYVESMFKTLKYCPRYPNKPFEELRSARDWVASFVNWYNNHHQHSGIKFVTPNSRHQGLDVAILRNRENIYELARSKHPLRWSKNTRNWSHIKQVLLNPGKGKKIAA